YGLPGQDGNSDRAFVTVEVQDRGRHTVGAGVKQNPALFVYSPDYQRPRREAACLRQAFLCGPQPGQDVALWFAGEPAQQLCLIGPRNDPPQLGQLTGTGDRLPVARDGRGGRDLKHDAIEMTAASCLFAGPVWCGSCREAVPGASAARAHAYFEPGGPQEWI